MKTVREIIAGGRWWLFKKISRVGWAVCPEPHRSKLYQSMSFDNAMWKDTGVPPHSLSRSTRETEK